MKKVVTVCMALFIILASSFASFGCAEEKPSEALPDQIVIGTTGLGLTGHIYTAAVSDAIQELTGIPVRMILCGTDMLRIKVMTMGDADCIGSYPVGAYCAWLGIDVFDTPEWGPQPLRTVWNGCLDEAAGMVRADSDIYTAADLKGKRLGVAKGLIGTEAICEFYLAFAGLTWDDVTRVEYPSYSAAGSGVVDGTCDFFGVMCNSSYAMQLAASPHGLRFLPTPAADTEAWARAWPYAPWLVPMVCTQGVGLSPENPVEGQGYQFCINTYESVNEDLIYEITKAIHEGYDLYKDKHPKLAEMTLEQCLDVTWTGIPFHDGAVRYLKEIGAWTAELEEWQNKAIEDWEVRRAAWEESQS